MTKLVSHNLPNHEIKSDRNTEIENLLERQILITNELRNELFELTQKSKYDSIINSIIFSIHKSKNIYDIYENAVESIYKIVEIVDHVFLYMTENKNIYLKASKGENLYLENNSFKTGNKEGIAARTLNENKTLNCNDTANDKILNDYEIKTGIKSYISTSIKHNGKAHGCLILTSKNTNNFKAQEIKLLETVALQIEIALKHHFDEKKLKESQLQLEEKYELLRKVTNREKVLRIVAESVHKTIELKDVMESAVHVMNEYILNNDYIGIYFVEGDNAILQSYRGYSDSFYEKIKSIAKPRGFTWKTIMEGKPLYVADVTKDTFIGKAGRDEGTMSYASMPLKIDGVTIGLININSKKLNAFDEDELALLETVAKQIETAIKNARQAELLKKINDELEIRVEERTEILSETNEQLKKEIREKEVLLTEIHHRVKNNLQIITSLLNLQSNKIKDKKLQKVFDESKSRIRSMSILHEHLYKSDVSKKIDFNKYIYDLTNHIYRSFGTSYNRIKLLVDAKGAILDIEKAIPCGLIINEIVSNAYEHGFPGENKDGYIKIEFYENDGKNFLIISNNGKNLNKDFKLSKSDTLGLQLVCSLTKQLKGNIDFNNKDKVEFKVNFDA